MSLISGTLPSGPNFFEGELDVAQDVDWNNIKQVLILYFWSSNLFFFWVHFNTTWMLKVFVENCLWKCFSYWKISCRSCFLSSFQNLFLKSYHLCEKNLTLYIHIINHLLLCFRYFKHDIFRSIAQVWSISL